MKSALRVLVAVVVTAGVLAAGAFAYLEVVGADAGELDATLVEAQAELERRQAALESCQDACEDEQKAVEKQQALLEVIRQEM